MQLRVSCGNSGKNDFKVLLSHYLFQLKNIYYIMIFMYSLSAKYLVSCTKKNRDRIWRRIFVRRECEGYKMRHACSL
jgi:hypothetical protein